MPAAIRCSNTLPLLQMIVPAECTIGRYGGEEFAVICVNMDVTQAAELAEQLRQKIEATPARFEDLRVPVTCSFGVAEKSSQTVAASGILQQADAALAIRN